MLEYNGNFSSELQGEKENIYDILFFKKIGIVNKINYC